MESLRDSFFVNLGSMSLNVKIRLFHCVGIMCKSGTATKYIKGVSPKWNGRFIEFREHDRSLKHELGSI